MTLDPSEADQPTLFDIGGDFPDLLKPDPYSTRPLYEGSHCWQYEIRVRNLERDLYDAGLTLTETSALKVTDFEYMPLLTPSRQREAAAFIRRHEWLGTLSQFTTHWFGAYYKGRLAGVILMNMPNSFSKLLGEDTPQLERLISRGACISWSPKNLASSFLMWCCHWMTQQSRYRLFTAYSDTTARELGTIYQACNFYYLGQNAGTSVRYINPYSGKVVSDRFFRVRSAYKQYAKELNIPWQPEWCNDQKMLWDSVPPDIEKALRDRSRLRQSESEKIPTPLKHKYALVLGSNRSETRALKRIFEDRNKICEYPKDR